MLDFANAQERTENFLTRQMLRALGAVEYELPSFDAAPVDVDLADTARANVEIRHVCGASEAAYLVQAFGDELLMQFDLNVYYLIVMYRTPALTALDANKMASVPSMPDGSSTGGTPRSRRTPHGVMSRPIAMHLPNLTSLRMNGNNSTGSARRCR